MALYKKGTYMTKQTHYTILSIWFFAAICLLGLFADVKVIKYYVRHETINEEWTPELGRKNETEYATLFPGKEVLLELNGGIKRLLGQREMNGVVRLTNDHVTSLKAEKVPQKDLRKEASNVAVLSDYLYQRGIPFLFVLPPDKITSSDGKSSIRAEKSVEGETTAAAIQRAAKETDGVIPAGYVDYANRNIDIFMETLDARGTAYLDLRKEIEGDGINPYDFFYKTDHHWTSQAGRYAFLKIADWAEKNTDVRLDQRARKEENFSQQTYEKVLSGTWAQRTGTLFAGSDDITVYTPNYETDVENLTFSKRGSLSDAAYNLEYLKEGKPDFIYDAVFDTTDQFVNYSADNDTTVLVICDSFGRVVNPFLILSARNMWFQSIYRSSEINDALLEKLQPDLVVMMFSPWYNLGKADSFAFSLPGISQ